MVVVGCPRGKASSPASRAAVDHRNKLFVFFVEISRSHSLSGKRHEQEECKAEQLFCQDMILDMRPDGEVPFRKQIIY